MTNEPDITLDPEALKAEYGKVIADLIMDKIILKQKIADLEAKVAILERTKKPANWDD